jgi:hypothetical protein
MNEMHEETREATIVNKSNQDEVRAGETATMSAMCSSSVARWSLFCSSRSRFLLGHKHYEVARG